MAFCDKLISQSCSILSERCFRLQQKSECDFLLHYDLLTNITNDPPISQKVKREMYSEFMSNWTVYAKNPSPGKKVMTAFPLENAIRKVLKDELNPLGLTIADSGEQFEVFKGTRIIADCLLKKLDYPTSIVSVKSWIGTTQLRETFAYAYLSKMWLGQKHIRVFMTTLQGFDDGIATLAEVCKPYLDGVYSLSKKPYFDKMVKELKSMYH